MVTQHDMRSYVEHDNWKHTHTHAIYIYILPYICLMKCRLGITGVTPRYKYIVCIPLWFWWFAKGFGKLALYKKKYMYKLRVKLSWILKNLQGTVLSLVRKRHEGCTVSSLWVKKKKSTCAILGFHTYLLPWKGEKLASFSVIRYPLNL